MNVLDWLVQDHDKFRGRMAAIHRSMAHKDTRDQVKELISLYEIHEAIEEEILFPAFDAALRARPFKIIAPDHEKMHEAMWSHLDKLVDSLNQCHHAGLLQAFFNFTALAEDHFRCEERVLFPVMRETLDEKTLKDLGDAAAAKLDRFASPIDPCMRRAMQ